MPVPILRAPLRVCAAWLFGGLLVSQTALAVADLARDLRRHPGLRRGELFQSRAERVAVALGDAAAGWEAARERVPLDEHLWAVVPETRAGMRTFLRLNALRFEGPIHVRPLQPGETFDLPGKDPNGTIWVLDLVGGVRDPGRDPDARPGSGALVASGPGFSLWRL